MHTKSKAQEIADILEASMIAVANGKMKPSSIPIEPICQAYQELRRLHLFELAYQEWSNKTEWIQGTEDSSELGMHIADVLKQRIENLQASNAELRELIVQALPLIKDDHTPDIAQI
jgi:hypothetical protein